MGTKPYSQNRVTNIIAGLGIAICGLAGCSAAKSGNHSYAPTQNEAIAYSVAAARVATTDATTAAPVAGEAPSTAPGYNTEAYDYIEANPFLAARDNPLSTFSIDVDTASYSNVRRFLHGSALPPPDAVRIEELINYFSYDYPQPSGTAPFSVITEVGPCPWNPAHKIVHVGLQGRRMPARDIPNRNLVFLLDVSGSMGSPNKLPLLKNAMRLLVEQLDERDRVAIAVYAGASGMVLPPTPGHQRADILAALDRLNAGGSTNGGAGIELAYRMAANSFIPGGVNRVILATDGDFNVGTTSRGDLIRLIENKRKSGVFLTVLGFGMGNLKDSTMEQLANKGNGNYAYIDTIREARKVLVEEAAGTLITIAKDVKIQVEFNPQQVSAYRLIGYENRLLNAEDFADDNKDAGEIGAGHTVTALYEIVPTGAPQNAARPMPALKYQRQRDMTKAASSDELVTIKLRYKAPNEDTSQLLRTVLTDRDVAVAECSDAFRFSAAVAAFGMLLRNSQYRGNAEFGMVRRLAESALAGDADGYRGEFLQLVDRAQALRPPARAAGE